MNDTQDPNDPHTIDPTLDDTHGSSTDTSSSKTGGKRRRRFFLFAAVAGLGALLVAIPAAFAGPFGGGGWRGGGGCSHGGKTMTAEQVRERMDTAADRVMGRVDGTDAQRAEVGALLDKLAPDAVALKKEAKAVKAQLKAAIESGEELDPTELERLRKEGLRLADKASKRALDALLDFQDVLTPEQRAELIGDLQRMQRWHR